jgi:hypothetical protein
VPVTHWHVAMLVVAGDDTGLSVRIRQVDIDYPTAEAAADVLVGLYERQLGHPIGPGARARVVKLYADNPRMSTEPPAGGIEGELLTVLPCEQSGEACIETGNAWGEQKVAMRKALGLL